MQKRTSRSGVSLKTKTLFSVHEQVNAKYAPTSIAISKTTTMRLISLTHDFTML